MSTSFDGLSGSPRVLVEVPLRPVAGSRIQPTGFPDLGAAIYDAPDGNGGSIPTLLVESAQSMANRLEAVCWDQGTDDLVLELQGLPYVKVALAGLGDGSDCTSSILEFHRLNSPYILQKLKDTTRTYTSNDKWFREVLREELGLANRAEETEGQDEKEPGEIEGVINLRRLASVCFKYDPCSLIHGVFLEKIAGRLRHPRALSAFIEAVGVQRADSGGVKFDRALPKPSVKGLDAKEGFGNVPFHRVEFSPSKTTAYFSIDLAQIRGYGLSQEATDLLVALSLWKIRKFLDSNMRLRTACELELADGDVEIMAKRPKDYPLPSASSLAEEIKSLIKKCSKLFANPPVTQLTWNGGKPAKTKVK